MDAKGARQAMVSARSVLVTVMGEAHQHENADVRIRVCQSRIDDLTSAIEWLDAKEKTNE